MALRAIRTGEVMQLTSSASSSLLDDRHEAYKARPMSGTPVKKICLEERRDQAVAGWLGSNMFGRDGVRASLKKYEIASTRELRARI